MSLEQVVFYIFSSIAIFAALGVITSRNPVIAAMSLVLTFFTCAALWILLEAEFLGVVLILVYVGAVMVLFLFVIMMLDINFEELREGMMKFLPVGVLVGLTIVVELVLVMSAPAFKMTAPPAAEAGFSNTEALGAVLYTDYVYPFEIAAVILLVAIIAAIVLTLRRRPEVKKQNPAEQIRVQAKDRVRLVKMDSEKSGGQP